MGFFKNGRKTVVEERLKFQSWVSRDWKTTGLLSPPLPQGGAHCGSPSRGAASPYGGSFSAGQMGDRGLGPGKLTDCLLVSNVVWGVQQKEVVFWAHLVLRTCRPGRWDVGAPPVGIRNAHMPTENELAPTVEKGAPYQVYRVSRCPPEPGETALLLASRCLVQFTCK